jgi:hypothetical protein
MNAFQRIALVIGIVGIVLSLIGAVADPIHFFQAYLFAYLFAATSALGCLAILMIQFTAGGTWGLVMRRILEAGTLTIPLLALLFIPLLFGLPTLYPWARPEVVAQDALLQHKAGYLNVPFFIVRALIYFVVWIGLGLTLRRWSRKQDEVNDPEIRSHLQRLSIIGLLALTLTGTFALTDWVMSLEPDWASTIYAMMVAMGGLLAAFALVIAVLNWLSGNSPMGNLISPQVSTDLGNLLLAALMMWAYLAFSQYLVIWSGNLSGEITWYVRRIQGGWQWIALLIVLFHFALPFLLLLSRGLKRNLRRLGSVGVLLVVMHLIDTYWLVIPALQGTLQVNFLPIATVLGIGGLWTAAFIWQLRRLPLLPKYTLVDTSKTQEAAANG